nr:replication/maintenance protein RepL [uncultured Anaerosporobacter sp.]
MAEITVSKEKNIYSDNSVTFDERKKQLEKEKAAEKKKNELEKKCGYKKFYQVNLENAEVLMLLSLHEPKARAILDFLLAHMDGYNALVCSYKVIQEALGISRTTAYEAIKVLTSKAIIFVAKSGNSTVFYVNDNLAWKSWGKNREYCEFSAKIILSGSENKDLLKKCKNHKAITTKLEMEK